MVPVPFAPRGRNRAARSQKPTVAGARGRRARPQVAIPVAAVHCPPTDAAAPKIGRAAESAIAQAYWQTLVWQVGGRHLELGDQPLPHSVVFDCKDPGGGVAAVEPIERPDEWTAARLEATRSAARTFWRTPMPSAAPTRARRAWTVRTSRTSRRTGSSDGWANWRLRSGRRLTDRTLSDAFSYRRPTANSGRWASQPCGIGSA